MKNEPPLLNLSAGLYYVVSFSLCVSGVYVCVSFSPSPSPLASFFHFCGFSSSSSLVSKIQGVSVIPRSGNSFSLEFSSLLRYIVQSDSTFINFFPLIRSSTVFLQSDCSVIVVAGFFFSMLLWLPLVFCMNDFSCLLMWVGTSWFHLASASSFFFSCCWLVLLLCNWCVLGIQVVVFWAGGILLDVRW